MNNPVDRKQHPNVLLFILFALAIAGTLLPADIGSWHVPHWFGGVLSLVALLAALTILWRQGAMKGGFLPAFLAALAIAASVGWYLSVRG